MIETRKTKFNKKMGLNLLLAASVFYFLPDFIMVDLLPDVIGYVLAAIGMTLLADICDDLEVARKKFMQLILLGAARMFGLFAVFALFDNKERPTAILMMTFIMAIVECLLLIPAVASLSEGLLYLGTRHDGRAVFTNPRKKRLGGRSYTDKVMRQTVVFVLFKNTLSVLPELLSLSTGENFQSYTYQLYDQVNVLRVFAMIAVSVAGIVWLCRVVKYLKAVMADVPFMESIAEKYRTEILPNESLFMRRRLSIAFLILTVGAFAAMDFYIDGNDGINVIPDIICAVCMMIGVLVASEKGNKWRLPTVWISAIYGIISTLTWKFNYDFTYAYTAKDVSREPIANTLWKILTAASVLESVCFVAMTVFVVLALDATIEEHTGYMPRHPSIDPVERARQIHTRLRRLLRAVPVVALLVGMACVLRVWMFCSESLLSDLSWIIEMLLSGAFAIVFAVALYRIKEAVEEKYMLL